jgi:tetratricopeptide (TPR) repeat protein
MPTRASRAAVESAVIEGRSAATQKTLLDRALGWAPLDWRLYFQRGLVAEHAGQFPAAADDFQRCLFLDQNSVALPLSVTEVCLPHDLPGALRAGQEVLRRSGRDREGMLAQIFAEPNLDEKARLQLATLAGDDPDLQMIALLNQDPADFDWSRENFLAANPGFEGVNPHLVRDFFDAWVQRGDAAKLAAAWPEHPEWEALAWRAHATALARTGLFDAAVTEAFQEIPPPPQPPASPLPPLRDALGEFLMRPQDAFAGIQLYQAQVAAGRNDEALNTLQTVARLPDAPPFVRYLLARQLSAAGRSQDAWNALQPLLNQP